MKRANKCTESIVQVIMRSVTIAIVCGKRSEAQYEGLEVGHGQALNSIRQQNGIMKKNHDAACGTDRSVKVSKDEHEL